MSPLRSGKSILDYCVNAIPTWRRPAGKNYTSHYNRRAMTILTMILGIVIKEVRAIFALP